MDDKKDKAPANGRRDFLKLAGLAAPAAVASATVAPQAAAADTSVEGEGLRRTPHVEAYLKSARF